MSQEPPKPPATRVALIGLIGTLLTVCSGATGVVLSAAATIYQTERARQQVVLAAPGSGQALHLDTGGIYISRQEAAALDPDVYFVDLDRGFAIQRPLPGWGELEQLTAGESMVEDGAIATPEPPFSEQPIYRIRYGEPVEFQIDRRTTLNGWPITQQVAGYLEQYYGPEPWTWPYYSQVVVSVLDKSAEETVGIRNLPDLFMANAYFSFGGDVSRLVAEDESGFIIVQNSAVWENVRVAGEKATVNGEGWNLYADGTDAYFVVSISYMPQSGQPVQVWDDMQAYMDSFRVVR